MIEKLNSAVLRLLKVPAEPEPPAGSAGSVKVFRAAPNFYKLNLIYWALRQASGLVGIILVLVFWNVGVGRRAPSGLNLVIDIVELAGVAMFFLQLPFTYLLVRLDYEMRWYMVTDRSLRIRSGLWNVRESTITFANIQQITIGQGPLQRLLGISDLEVSTAGGGSGGGPRAQAGAREDSMHRGFFHGIDNAQEVRALILERQRQLRDAGLGDPDDDSAGLPPAAGGSAPVQAARELLEEIRRLRQAVG